MITLSLKFLRGKRSHSLGFFSISLTMPESVSQAKLLNKQASKVKLPAKQAASLYNYLTNEDQGDVAQIEIRSEREIIYT